MRSLQTCVEGTETDWLIVRLSGDQDGIEQITEALSESIRCRCEFTSSAMATEAGIQLGNTVLDSSSAAGYASELSSWAGSPLIQMPTY